MKWRKLLQIFLNERDQPYGDLLTSTQVQIIDIIAKRRYPRTQLILPTQYGKSLCVAQGILLRVSTHKEKWAIVAPTEDKARIIMDYIIDHIFDSPVFSEQLEYNGSKEKLKQERSKTRITFKDGGEVRVFSADAGNAKKVKKALMGYGAANIILDEAALIPDDLYATVKRMLAGTVDNFLLEIGNPSYRNHFFDTWFGDRYMKIFVDVYMALKEGRYSHDYIEEMRPLAGFDWMFECLFPEAAEVLANGYRRLISDLIITDALIDDMPPLNYKHDEQGQVLENKYGHKIVDDDIRLGIDVAAGGANKTKFVLRFPKHGFSRVVRTSESDDEEVLADIAEEIIREWTIGDYMTAIDAGGVGHGLPAIMRKRGYLVRAVLFGEKEQRTAAGDLIFKVPKAFLNMRAYMYFEARDWLSRENGKLLRDDGFLELKLINYRQNSTLKLQIEPKDVMIKREAADGNKVESPDTADAFVLTFVDTSSIVDEDDIFVD